MQAYHKFAALKLDVEVVENHFRQADQALTAVERLHVRPHLVQDVANPVLHNLVPQRIGAFVGRMQVFALTEVHDGAGAVADRRIL